MEDNDDDYFSDDGFDSLPPGTLLQLEQNAYRATQVQKAQQPPRVQQPEQEPVKPLRNAVPSLRTEDSNRSVYSNATLKFPSRLHTGFTNEYGALDVGELDAEVLDDDNRQAKALEPLYGFANRSAPGQHYAMDGMQLDEPTEVLREKWEPPQVVADKMEVEEAYNPGAYEEMQELAARIEELRRQNEQVMRELAEAKTVAATKTGEISIIRSNQARLAENYDRQLAALRKAMADEIAKHKEEVEAARAEGKMLATENAFLKQDLAEEALRINNLKAKSKIEEKGPPVTPRKTRVLPFRDGFDDDEIAVVSPSKSAGTRSKRATPTVPGKRKRKLSQDSPTQVVSLQLSPQPPPTVNVPGDVSDDTMVDAQHGQTIPQMEDRNLRFMKQILNHRSPPNKDRDIEEMAKLSYPSEPQRMLSTIILEVTATLGPGNYPVEYARCIAALWSRALKEKFFKPIPMFMSIVRFIITLDIPSFVPDLIDHLVPVLQESGDVNGVPRFKHSPVSRQNLGQIRQTPLSELQPEVDSTEALSLLYQMACGCLHIDSALQNFWRHIRYDFILMMLNCSQPIRDIILTLNLLSTSIRPGSFGSIQETEQDQIANENYIVDRVANLLSEMPQVDEGQDPYTPYEICTMRLEALSLLTAIAFNPIEPANHHGSSVIASHKTVLARLIRAMHDELDALYSYPPERDLHSTLVNELMRLIYGVIRRHRENVDLQWKLGQVAGGKQKFLVVFTRLAFSEGLVLEAGITDETVEMAHEILDDAVNPQEAESLLEVFPSAKRNE